MHQSANITKKIHIQAFIGRNNEVSLYYYNNPSKIVISSISLINLNKSYKSG